VAWAGYIERGETDPNYDWVTDFEEKTGCKVKVKIAATSDEMVALMNEGGFDLVTASGDASNRLISGKRVQEINIALVPSWNKIDPRLQNAPWHTVGGKHYGVPYQWGSNVLMYNTKVFPTPPTSWKVVFEEMTLPDGQSNKGRVQAYDGPIYIADAALYLKKHRPELGSEDPYALDRKQFEAAIELLRQQRKIVGRYWHDAFIQIDDFINEGVVASSSWPFQVNLLKSQGAPIIYVTHDQEEALTMSDRLAVFNHGQIEQVGTPAAIYEHPATSFVAGFVGVSNLVSGAVAQAITGVNQTFSIRPEKIRIQQPDTPIADGLCAAHGCIRDVVYLGVHTRYIVELDVGGELTVIQQNLDTTSMEVLAARGRRVQLVWQRAHNRVIA